MSLMTMELRASFGNDNYCFALLFPHTLSFSLKCYYWKELRGNQQLNICIQCQLSCVLSVFLYSTSTRLAQVRFICGLDTTTWPPETPRRQRRALGKQPQTAPRRTNSGSKTFCNKMKILKISSELGIG